MQRGAHSHQHGHGNSADRACGSAPSEGATGLDRQGTGANRRTHRVLKVEPATIHICTARVGVGAAQRKGARTCFHQRDVALDDPAIGSVTGAAIARREDIDTRRAVVDEPHHVQPGHGGGGRGQLANRLIEAVQVKDGVAPRLQRGGRWKRVVGANAQNAGDHLCGAQIGVGAGKCDVIEALLGQPISAGDDPLDVQQRTR